MVAIYSPTLTKQLLVHEEVCLEEDFHSLLDFSLVLFASMQAQAATPSEWGLLFISALSGAITTASKKLVQNICQSSW